MVRDITQSWRSMQHEVTYKMCNGLWLDFLSSSFKSGFCSTQDFVSLFTYLNKQKLSTWKTSFFHEDLDTFLGIDKRLLIEKLQAGFLVLGTIRDGTIRYSFLIEKSLIAVFLKMFMHLALLRLI